MTQGIRQLTLLPGMAIHVGLQRRRSGKSLVAHLAFVLLLRVGRHFRTELAHHRLRPGGRAARQETRRSGKGSGRKVVEGF